MVKIDGLFDEAHCKEVEVDAPDFELIEILKYFDEPEDAQILDVGCANSHFYEVMKANGWNIDGVDMAFKGEKDEWTREDFLNYNPTEKCGPDTGIEFTEQNQYDAIVAISSIEHMGLPKWTPIYDPYADVKACYHIWQLLKPNGHFYTTIPIGRSVTTTDWRIYNIDDIWGRICGSRFAVTELVAFQFGTPTGGPNLPGMEVNLVDALCRGWCTGAYLKMIRQEQDWWKDRSKDEWTKLTEGRVGQLKWLRNEMLPIDDTNILNLILPPP